MLRSNIMHNTIAALGYFISVVSSAPTSSAPTRYATIDNNYYQDDHRHTDWRLGWDAMESIANLVISISNLVMAASSIIGVIYTYKHINKNNEQLRKEQTELNIKHTILISLIKRLQKDIKNDLNEVRANPSDDENLRRLEDDVISLTGECAHFLEETTT